MNLKLKRSARTECSEEVLIYSTETLDENERPVNIGKLDLHYLEDQIVGTLLIWQEFADGYARANAGSDGDPLDALIDDILSEISEPLGVPGEYGIEVYYPSINNYRFYSTLEDDDTPEEDDEKMEGTAPGGDYFDERLRTRS